MNKRLRLRGILWAGLSVVLALSPMLSQAEIVKSKTIDNGSSGPYKAVAVTESSLKDCVVYRPVDIDAAVAKEGKLPVLVWANGGCMDSSINHERVLSEIASRGYIIVAIGTLQMTQQERAHRPTPDEKLLELIAWISEQAEDSDSDYYKKVDLEKIAAGGQSCGGAQVMRVANDPRIKTYMMFNSGMGDMTMAGASKESLKALHGPVIYIVGGPSDVAYANAQLDYDHIDTAPVAFTSLEVGHGGTFAEEFGGPYSVMALSWLDWHFKGKTENASVFLKSDLEKFPGWTVKAKNFEGAPAAKAASPENVEIKITRDIAYREGESGAWKLDMAMPVAPATGLRPALVIVHGGGWSAGDKSDAVYQTMMKEYAQLGYVTINVNYRLTREAEFPACIEDVKCAVRWLRAHADEYNVDPDRIGAYGHSAGAHLSLMLAMVPKSAGLEGDGGWNEYSSLVNVVAAGSPPTELGRGGPMAKSEWWPIDYIRKDHPPIFLIQGLQDRIVRPELTTDFVDKMKAAGADIKYLTLDGHHGVAFDQHLDVTKPALVQFFAEHLKPKAPAGNGEVAASAAAPQEITITRDISYREGESKAWTLDMAMPAVPADGMRPALVIVHGGGWAAGSKDDEVYQTMMKEYAQLGYVTINVNYRLTREAEFPACIEDVKCAVRWLRAHADEYKVDPDRIGAYGHSAGAHLSLMLAMAPKSAGLEGDGGWDEFSSVVNVAAAGSPPTELGRGGPMAKSEWWPIAYIGGDHPPLLLIQGLQDPIVRPALTTDFVDKMKAADAEIKYMKLDGDHDVAYSDLLEITKPALEAFFAEHLKPATPTP